ncbi:MAG: copper amine oxidase N-terminal domain-containing protein, partial [Firmicutes bacterium]|nr:copper amine oxidase N-terminal domain-containing protein [Bacillota bacterium]
MKKILCFALCLAAFFSATAYAEEITVEIDGAELLCEPPPINTDDRVLVPMRAIFEALGADVEWDGERQRVIIETA